MSRIIIENRSKNTDVYALELVSRVISQGRVSNNGKQYCYLTSFTGSKTIVVTDLNKASDRFIVYDEKGETV